MIFTPRKALHSDPTQNVLDLVQASITRQDDLRDLEAQHMREVANLRADYDERLRRAESARIDAIRAVDVGNVQRAAEASAVQASVLAAQVATSAETLRTAAASAATTTATALAAALDPIQKDIADLRRAQYEAQGVRANVGESRLTTGTIIAIISLISVFVVGIATVLVAILH